MADTSLRQRARRATPAELDAIPWLMLLDGGQRERAVSTLEVADAEPGERLCRIGRPATFWFGVVDGLLKMNNDDSTGQAVTFTGIPPGGWFGEGTLSDGPGSAAALLYELTHDRWASLPRGEPEAIAFAA